MTGSGKTEVYIQAIDEVLCYGRQAIVLVPEISLTPQTEQRFRSRFGRVAVLHSHQSDVERHRHWQQIAAGEVQVVVGARSAIFAPTPHLGLMVLDEEHEASFKQDSSPRYHARDVALARARLEQIPLVLGSATPSLESWHRAQQGVYQLLSLPERVFERPLPRVGTIDLRLEFQNRKSRGAVSRQLHVAMDEALKDDGQVILLLNRRGYTTHIQCPACGHVVRCPQCSIALTHHLTGHLAICHYCDYQIPPPAVCPECRSPGIRYSGVGTQRLEAEVKARFPHHRCLRMDTDTMQKPGSHERALAAFHSGEVKILLGTQMIAKGLDFPNVTLVGVINADTALHLPDFRAAERTFQLVTQVAGRTGRGPRGGRVLVQTFSPEHPAIMAAVRHDYAAFARQELPTRAALCYPPFSSMIRLVVRGPVEAVAQATADDLGRRLRGGRAARFGSTRVGSGPGADLAPARQIPLSAADPGDRWRQACTRRWSRPRPTSRRPTRSNGSPTSTRSICSKRRFEPPRSALGPAARGRRMEGLGEGCPRAKIAAGCSCLGDRRGAKRDGPPSSQRPRIDRVGRQLGETPHRTAMSYRSLKRVLGETSLERKCLFLFGTCLLILITSGFWWYSSQTDDLVLDATRRIRRWAERNDFD